MVQKVLGFAHFAATASSLESLAPSDVDALVPLVQRLAEFAVKALVEVRVSAVAVQVGCVLSTVAVSKKYSR